MPVREPVLMEDHHLVVDVRRRVWLVCVHAHMRTIDCEREVRDGGDPRDLVREEVERVDGGAGERDGDDAIGLPGVICGIVPGLVESQVDVRDGAVDPAADACVALGPPVRRGIGRECACDGITVLVIDGAIDGFGQG